MNSSVPALLYVNTQTALDIYEANKEEFDQSTNLGDTEVKLLREEYNKVDGMEALYGFFVRQNDRPLLSGREGAEGFMDSIKSGVNKIVDMIKSFFKWIWSFFSGSKEKSEKKAETVKEEIKKKGIKPGKHKYPGTSKKLFSMFEKQGNNLQWLKRAITQIEGLISQTKAYGDKLNTYYSAQTSLTGHKDLTRDQLNKFFREHPYDQLTSVFKGSGQAAPGGKGDIHLIGVFYAKPNSGGLNIRGIPNPKASSVFEVSKTDESLVLDTIEKAKKLLKEAGELTQSVANMESIYVKIFTNFVEIKDPGRSTSDMRQDDLSRLLNNAKSITNRSISTIKRLEEIIFQCINGVLDTANACVGATGEKDEEEKK